MFVRGGVYRVVREAMGGKAAKFSVSPLMFDYVLTGWLKGTIAPSITVVAILIGLGHSLLAMSGEESLAQVYREIEAPKHKNLIRAGLVIFVFS